VDAVDLVGPAKLVGLYIDLPGPHAGKRLGLPKQVILALEVLLRLLTGRDIQQHPVEDELLPAPLRIGPSFQPNSGAVRPLEGHLEPPRLLVLHGRLDRCEEGLFVRGGHPFHEPLEERIGI